MLAVSPDKAMWRELHALVAHRNKDNVGGLWAVRPAHGSNAKSRDMIVAGMVRDKAEVVDTLESVYHIPGNLQTAHGQLIYGQGVQYAANTARKLGWAVDTYRETIDSGWKDRLKKAGAGKIDLQARLRRKAFIQYWTAAEQLLPLLFACVEKLGSDEHPKAKKEWQRRLFFEAHRAYSTACAPQTPRQHRAFALGLARLGKPAAEEESANAPPETSSDTSHEEDNA
jgi:CRISPR system Cascade subunit CasA